MKIIKKQAWYVWAMTIMLINSCSTGKHDPAPAKSSAKDILSFTLTGPGFTLTGAITGTTISFSAPAGANLTALVPVISVSAKASVSPAATGAVDFSKSVSYTVTAEDGSTKVYTVTVLIGKSTAKAITVFAFNGLSPAVDAMIDETAKTITATVPSGTALTALVPTITVAAKAKVSPGSGLAQNFSKEVDYTVTAEDGSTQLYKVTISIAPSVTRVIDCKNIPLIFDDLGAGVDYIVGCNIKVDGGLLTIKPGVSIQFDGAASGITVINGGALNMVGTAAKPIVLEGKTPGPGNWTGIQLGSGNVSNQWQYVTVKDAGAGKYPAGLYIDSHLSVFGSLTAMALNNCTFNNNSGYGIREADNDASATVFSSFANNTFTNNQAAGLRLTINAIGKLDTKSTYVNNAEKLVEITGASGLHVNTSVQAIDAPYLIIGSIGIHQRFNIAPGVSFQFYTDAGFNLDAQYNGAGTFIANGTAAKPIKFTGYQSGKAVWLGLSLGNNDPENLLNYCVIDGAGSNKPNGSACTGNTKGAVNFFPDCNTWSAVGGITNSTVTNSGGYGIIYKKGSGVAIRNNTYSGNTLDNVKAF